LIAAVSLLARRVGGGNRGERDAVAGARDQAGVDTLGRAHAPAGNRLRPLAVLVSSVLLIGADVDWATIARRRGARAR
jgi:hypothetical protein